jgi:hypothetical protein
MAKKKTRIGHEARNVPMDVKKIVLHESGYMCSVPTCRHPITLDIHHLIYVADGGKNDPHNLIALCPNHHSRHHREGLPPTESLRTWKMLLLTLNEGFDRRSINLLLATAKLNMIDEISGDGVVDFAPLVACGLVNIEERLHNMSISSVRKTYTARLSDKGK